MQVQLIHGMGRTILSLRRLARELRRAGHHPDLLGYVATVEPFTRIVRRVQKYFAIAGARGPYVVVGHSLGGLVARAALEPPVQFAPPVHLIMLGTPNHPSRQARRFRRAWVYRWLNGECGQLLAREEFFDRLPPLSVPYTVVAGTGGRRGPLSFFGADLNDGMVSVAETLVSPSDAPVTAPVRHTFMMNDHRVHAAILQVLESVGRQDPRDAGNRKAP